MNDKLKVLLHAVAEVTNIDTATLRQHKSKTHKIAFAKHVYCYVGCIKLRFKQQDIGNYIGLSQSRVCQVTSRSNFMRVNNQGCKGICDEVLKVEERFEELSDEVRLGKVTL